MVEYIVQIVKEDLEPYELESWKEMVKRKKFIIILESWAFQAFLMNVKYEILGLDEFVKTHFFGSKIPRSQQYIFSWHEVDFLDTDP